MNPQALKEKETSQSTETAEYRDLRKWMEQVDSLGELKHLDGAHWDTEIGTITEMCMQRPDASPALLFDKIKDYPEGFRILSNSLNTTKRVALTLHMEPISDRLEFVRRIKDRLGQEDYIPPKVVEDGPILENVVEGKDIDMWKFPTPKWHELDGGRYIGTGSVDITQDPDDGWVNLGTYRVMIQNKDTLGFYISPGKQGRIMREKYFAKGEPCKVVVSFGHDPIFLCAGGTEIPRGLSEFDWIGGMQGYPVEVIKGEYTGIPFPAHAEIVVEAEATAGELMDEGPFGEWTGYYASSMRAEPIMKVKRLYYRDDPIILGAPPGRPPCEFNFMRCFLRSALIWREIEGAGLPDIRGVWCNESGCGRLMTVVALKQRYAGHAKQAGMLAAYCQAGAYLGRYVVVVDEDIDPTNTYDVLWAMCTRSNPENDIEIIRNSWSGPLDPILPPGGKKMFSSRAIIDACRPYDWIADFPPVAESSPEIRKEVAEKWQEIIFGDSNSNGSS